MALPQAMSDRADNSARRLFAALEIALPASDLLPAKTLRLLDGSAVLTFLGHTWVGQDGDYGSWRGGDAIEEVIATQAASTTVTLAPLSDAVQQQLGQPKSQGAPITLYCGEVDITAGLPVSDPEPVFYGALDVGHIKLGRNSRTITIDVMSALELMFLTDDGSTLTSSWHNEFFPDSLGFAFVDSVAHQDPWGAKGPRPDQATGAHNYDTDRGGGRTSLRF